MMQVPGELFLGRFTGWELVFELVRAGVWVVVLWAGTRLLLRGAMRRVVVQGG